MYSPADIRSDVLNDIMSSYYLHNYRILGLNGVWVYGDEDETGTRTTLETPCDFVDGILHELTDFENRRRAGRNDYVYYMLFTCGKVMYITTKVNARAGR